MRAIIAKIGLLFSLFLLAVGCTKEQSTDGGFSVTDFAVLYDSVSPTLERAYYGSLLHEGMAGAPVANSETPTEAISSDAVPQTTTVFRTDSPTPAKVEVEAKSEAISFAPAGESIAPAKETTAPAEESITPAGESIIPADETIASSEATTAPAGESTIPAEETFSPAKDTLSREYMLPLEAPTMPEFGILPLPENDSIAINQPDTTSTADAPLIVNAPQTNEAEQSAEAQQTIVELPQSAETKQAEESQHIAEATQAAEPQQAAAGAGANIANLPQLADELPQAETLIPAEPLDGDSTLLSPLYSPVSQPILALKTNLLFDAASLLNVELEVPIGKHWSIALEYCFPWWKQNDWDFTAQLQQGTLEARYWFGRNRTRDVHPDDPSLRTPLTGWFMGLYAGGGMYDFQFGNGIQGEFLLMGGLSGGFAHTVGKSQNMRMEYSLGVGYLQTDYRGYTPVRSAEYGYIKVREYPWEVRRQTWIGPTRAKISFVYLFNTGMKSQKKGGKP